MLPSIPESGGQQVGNRSIPHSSDDHHQEIQSNQHAHQKFYGNLDLKWLLSLTSGKAIHELFFRIEQFEELMRSLTHKDNTLVEIVKVLAHIINVKKIGHKLEKILNLILSDPSLEGFLFSLTLFIRRMPMIGDTEKRKELPNVLQAVIAVFDFLLTNYSTRKVVEYLPIDVCIGTAHQLSLRGSNCYQDINKKAQQLLDKRNKMCTEVYESEVSINSSQSQSDEWTIALPTSEDLHHQPNVTPNIVNGEFPNVQEYLKIQRDLLREDFIIPFRTALKGSSEHSDKIFTGVRFLGKTMVTFSGETSHKVWFRPKNVNWRRSKLLDEGSLVCFSKDDFGTVFYATVTSRRPEELARGILNVKLESRNWHSLLKCRHLIMIQSPGYFKGYAPVIEKLHKIVPENLPFSQYFAKLQTAIDQPKYMYLREDRPIFDLKGVVCDCDEGCIHRQVNILDRNSWENLTPSTLDASQKDALYLTLTNELALIQGPPGTGKSYIGLKAMQALLQNAHLWRSPSQEGISKSPIMVVCYTNHALDQFLEGVIKLGLSKYDIVRMGRQYEDPKFERFSLHWKVRQARRQRKRGQFLRIYQPNIAVKSKALYEFINGDFKSDHCHQYCLFLSQEVIFDLQDYCDISIPFQSDDRMPLQFVSWFDEDIQLENEALRSINEERLDDEDFESHKLYIALGEEGLKTFIHKFKRVHPMKTQQARQYLKDHLHPPKSTDRLPLLKYCLNELLKEFQNQEQDSNQQLSNAMYKRQTKDIKVSVLQNAKVIGATTTAAARESDLLSKVQSKILIVEEAAEVLEPHLVASLTQHTQHLILIGDHKQLRPKSTDSLFGRSHKLEISLFERLISNGLPHATLKFQRRMRPEISRIVSDHMYDKKLIDHETTKEYEHVRGIKHNLYFINHDKEESPEDPDMKSHSNEHEASFIACLYKYLLYHEYKAHQITVITSYKSQEYKISSQLQLKGIDLDDDNVRVTTIDNYQGEENDIILLSLVRSNKQKNVGFLKVKNRVCVALSRARCGFYCIGNFQLFQESCEFWSSIIDDLKSKGILSDSLELVCHRHKIVTKVSCADDFEQVPDGGCNLPCIAVYKDCRHQCPRKCHPDDKNHDSPCPHPCQKLLPNCGHPCTKKCSEECDETCTQKVSRELLCGHKQKVECYLNEFQSIRMCKHPCGVKLLCGHYCYGDCGKCYQGHLHIPCIEKCTKILFCGHECPGTHSCSSSCPPCAKDCAYECPHGKCGICFQPCKPCHSESGHQCQWRCQHLKCTKLCGEPCDRDRCKLCDDRPCTKRLRCRHPCLGLRGERCPPVCHKCKTVAKKVHKIYSDNELNESTRHRYIQLEVCRHVFAVQALDTWMESRKDEPISWKCCPDPACRAPIVNTLRYIKTTNQILHDVNKVKKRESRYLNSHQREQMKSEFSLLAPIMCDLSSINLEQEEDEVIHWKYLYALSKFEILKICSSNDELLGVIQESKNEQIVSIKSLLLLQSQAKGFLEWTDRIHESNIKLSDQMILNLTAEHKRLLLLLKCYRLQYALSTTTDAEKHCKVIKDIQTVCEDSSTRLSREEYQAKISKLKSLQEEHGIRIIGDSEGEIISTLGLKADGWYKCSNGHYYNFNNTIDEYDGKCPECWSESDYKSHAQTVEDVMEYDDSTSTRECCIVIIDSDSD